MEINQLAELYKEFQERVEKENKAFSEADDAGKRVIIARDVLRHLESGLINTTPGNGYGDVWLTRAPYGSDLRRGIIEEVVQCQACARGAVVYSAVMRRGGVKGVRLNGQMIPDEFPKKTMLGIEAVFEVYTAHVLSYINDFPLPIEEPDTRLAMWRIWKHATEPRTETWRDDTTARKIKMVLIMRWIVDHNGEFSVLRFLRDMTTTDTVAKAIAEFSGPEMKEPQEQIQI